ncbi:MAG: hypothetical protein AAB242_09305 [Nitrospirota bacterium]
MCASHRFLLVNPASMAAGFKATTTVVKARIHREGGNRPSQVASPSRDFVDSDQGEREVTCHLDSSN